MNNLPENFWDTVTWPMAERALSQFVQGVFLVGGSPLFVDYAHLMVPALASKSVHFLPLEMFAWKEIYGKNASRDAVTTGMAGAQLSRFMQTPIRGQTAQKATTNTSTSCSGLMRFLLIVNVSLGLMVFRPKAANIALNVR